MSTPTAATNGSEAGAKKGQQQRTAAAAGKALDGQRKGNNGSPAATAAGEGGRKQKAWSGTNPTILPQRSATPNGTSTEKPLPKLPSQAQQQQPQQNNNTKQQVQQQPQPEVNGVADKHAHDRLLYVLGICVGLDATISLKSGEQFTGVFTGFSSSTNNTANGKYVLSMVRRTHAAPPPQQQNENTQTNGHATPTAIAESSAEEEFVGEGEDHTMAFDIQDTTCLSVDDVVVSAPQQQNGSAIQPAGFRTDTDISGAASRSAGQLGQQRELQRWDAGQDTDVDLSLESSAGVGGLGGGIEGWDQFATNESKFGVGSTYKEEYYTTAIDRSRPGFGKREQEAERIAREMEGDGTKNNGVRGGRSGDVEGDEEGDEEDRYSGVRRENVSVKEGGGGSGQARESAGLLPKRKEGAYVPPRERPITGGPAPGVNGAPWDPAILSTSKPAPKETGAPTIVEPAKEKEEGKSGQLIQTPSATSRDTSTMPRTSQQAAPPTTAESSTQDHISKTIDAFKLFASNEKLKVRQQQELKRAGARQEKNVKLNDLKKFAANFKLNSRVPDDLVPILAKDREKQVAIQQAAEAAAKEAELSPKKSGEKKRGSPLGGVREGSGKEGGNKSQVPEVSRGEKLRGAQVLQQQMRSAQGGGAQSPRSPAFPQQGGQQGRNGSGQHQGFGRGGPQVMPAQQQQQQAHAPLMHAPSSQAPSSSQAPPPPQLPAVRIPDGPAGWQGGAGAPLSPASRFNINAMEFRPIAANLASTTPSPKRKGSATTNATAVVAEPAQQKMTSKISSDSFFGKGGKPIEEQDRKDADEEYDPVKRMLAQKDFASEVEKKAVMGNGGVVQPFKTGPTWPGKEGESFLAAFQKHQLLVEQPAMQVAAQALQHQLPPPHHVQGPPPQGMVGTPSQRHQQYFAGQNTPQHGGFADPRMMGQQFGGSVQSSPRFQSAQMAQQFGGQIPPHMQQGGPQMPGPQYSGGGQYGMSPSMQQRQMMPQQQQQQQQGMMMPQQYGQANGRFQGRRGSKGGQQQQQQQWGGGPDERGQRGGFPAPQHFGGGGGVPMMQTLSQQGHGGQFMNGPPPANMGGGYSPMPHQAQMQGGYSGSPGRPTMMAHSGSHQGFNPQQQQQQMHGMHGGPPPPQGPGMQQQQGQPFAMGPGGAHPMHWQQQQRQMSGGYGGGPSPQHSGGMTPRSQQALPMLQQGGGGGGHSGLNSPAAVGMGQGGEEVKGG
ncbi:poly(A)-binding protein binding protein [Elasticomyces elasticus]|nr:poly(A)-binding protein binding protein [Elasticomyces elasticus]KAK3655821.1 poly(A)-binding protein binding protein [Elasticomyces elasticus]KAK4925839.1 poly(A)-binding protein binding protein [Elasticomyces elasticus]KAK5764793.1 poly(A)-binding protein binding protein [Elasticomyces elasticus]